MAPEVPAGLDEKPPERMSWSLRVRSRMRESVSRRFEESHVPTYEYACTNCGNEWEAEQSMKDAALTECPKCHNQTAKRQISRGAGFILKGGGWYSDLYSSSTKSSSSDTKSTEGASSSSSSSESSAPSPKAESSTKSESPSTTDSGGSKAKPTKSD